MLAIVPRNKVFHLKVGLSVPVQDRRGLAATEHITEPHKIVENSVNHDLNVAAENGKTLSSTRNMTVNNS